jgi:hypothetical protein
MTVSCQQRKFTCERDRLPASRCRFAIQLATVASRYQNWYSQWMTGTGMLRIFRGASLICFCILGVAVITAPLELAAYPIISKATGCSWTEVMQSFACGDGWVGHSIATVLNLPMLFSSAREFTFSAASASLSREYVLLLYLFDVIFILALTYPLLLLFTRKSGRRSS